jgi:hypothetical protein
MQPYARPPIDAPVFRDAAGQVIAYGHRWGGNSPPDDSYSVTSNLERFRPLHAVAGALIEFLRSTYDVAVSEGHEGDILHTRSDIVRATRITPRDPAAAPLTFVFTSFPSVIVHAGVLTDFLYPFCGCDACDESWEGAAEEMEWQALAVAAGNFSESHWSGRRFSRSIESLGGGAKSSGEMPVDHLPIAKVEAAASVLDALPNGWVNWPLAERAG